MRLICCVIHHRNDRVPEELLKAKEVLQVAIVADKYDLGLALSYARAQWLKPSYNEDMENTAYLMAAVFLFCDMDAFVTRSLDLTLHYKDRY
ncbi:hypothetical protein QQZ08_002723 [Neonectria magnoliae]|uniref:Sesquiterpene synthase n=1 Tax=Neonectria magnoliae TaxID=2732573 RepID=A0ABR1IBP8_9HYPO